MTAKAKTWILSACIFYATFGWLGAVAQAQPIVDVWNVNISGIVIGTGYLYFDVGNPNTVKGYIIIKPNRKTNPLNQPAVFDFGFFGVTGQWFNGPKNTVGGFFSGGSAEIPFDVTSFSASVKTSSTSKKLTMKATTTDGPMKVSGTPAIPLVLPDLTGTWTATVLKDGVKFNEIFDLALAPSVCVLVDFTDPTNPECFDSVPAFNTYTMAGNGPSYELGKPANNEPGMVVLSARNQIGLVVEEFEIDKNTQKPADSGIIRSVVGTFNPSQNKASMTGEDDSHLNVQIIMTP
jgi:hypothetical protein